MPSQIKNPLFSVYIVCIHFFIFILYTPLYIYLVYLHDTPLMTPHAFYNAPCFFWCILWMHITSPTMQLINHVSLWFGTSNGIMKRWYYDLIHEHALHTCLCLSNSLLYQGVSTCQLLLYPCVSSYRLILGIFSPPWSLLSSWYLHEFSLTFLPLCDCLRVYHHYLYLQFISTWFIMGFTFMC